MNTITILVGVSGSGKTTKSLEMLKQNPKLIRINRDDLRKCVRGTLKGYYSRNINYYEELITYLSDTIAIEALDNGKDLLIDNTNLSMKYIKDFIGVPGYDTKVVLFETPINDCKERVYIRDFNGREDWFRIEKTEYLDYPEVAYIDKQYKQLENIKKELQALNNIDLEIINN
jgi:predicted kinase